MKDKLGDIFICVMFHSAVTHDTHTVKKQQPQHTPPIFTAMITKTITDHKPIQSLLPVLTLLPFDRAAPP